MAERKKWKVPKIRDRDECWPGVRQTISGALLIGEESTEIDVIESFLPHIFVDFGLANMDEKIIRIGATVFHPRLTFP